MPSKAGVLGKPVGHSLSPVLHYAAYRELGLSWTFERIEVDAQGLPILVGGLGPEWAGLSVTMPGKRAALEFATVASARARAAGAANTLVHQGSEWFADCTDVDGVVGALRAAGGFDAPPDSTGVILGAGGTAAATLVAFAELKVGRALLVVRDPARATEAVAVAGRAGVEVEVLAWPDGGFADVVAGASVLVSTVPAEAVAGHARELSAVPCLLDVVYHPWPTPLAEAAAARDRRVATGLDMLLHQAFGQVEQFTGRAAPRETMREALRDATGEVLPLPLA